MPIPENYKKLVKSFEILGLKPGASLKDIQEAYKDLVKVWHPDRFANDPKLQHKAQEKMKEVNEAYQTIQDAQEKPHKYNLSGDGFYQEPEPTHQQEQQANTPPPPQPPPPNSSPPTPPPSNPKNDDQPAKTGVWAKMKNAWYIVISCIPAYGAYNSWKQYGEIWPGLIAGLIVAGILYAAGKIIVFAYKKAGVIRIAFYCVAIFLSLLVGWLIYTRYERTETYAECMKAYGNKTTSPVAAQVISAACNNIVKGNKVGMTFDTEGAKKAGYTDAEITDHIRTSRREAAYYDCIISSMPNASNDMVARAIIQECRKKSEAAEDLSALWEKSTPISKPDIFDELARQQSPKHDGTISVFTDYQYGQTDIYIDGVYAGQLNRYFPDGYTDPKCEGLGTVSKTLQEGEHKLYAKNPNGTVWPEWTFYIKEGECRIVKLPKPLAGAKDE